MLEAIASQLDDGIMGSDSFNATKNMDDLAKHSGILDLETGNRYSFVEGTSIRNSEVFAGNGTNTVYRKAYVYANSVGSNIEDWQHAKGFAMIATDEGDRYAEIH